MTRRGPATSVESAQALPVAIIPVKRLSEAKSRLDVPARTRQRLALGFALDTINTVIASRAFHCVLVVTHDPRIRCALRTSRVVTIDEGRSAGLDAAIDVGRRRVHAHAPGSPTVVVPADLPCMRGPDLAAAVLASSGRPATFVRDVAGDGTTLLLRRADAAVDSHYGLGSALRHAQAGATELCDVAPGVRHDVDTLEDLFAAERLGVGPVTRQILARRPFMAGQRAAPNGRGSVTTMATGASRSADPPDSGGSPSRAAGRSTRA